MEEMGLRDFIKVIWSAKWLIAIITAVCLVLGSVYAIVIMDSSFRAKTLLSVYPLKINANTAIVGIDSVTVDFLTLAPNSATETYLEQIKSSSVLEPAVKALESVYGLSYSVTDLKSKTSIDTPKNTNLIYIQAVDENSENAKKIANSVSNSFISYTQNLVTEYAEDSVRFYEEQFLDEENNISDILFEIVEFESLHKGVETIKDDLINKKYILNSHIRDLVSLEIDIKTNNTGLETAVDLLEKTQPFIVVVKAIGDETILAEALNEDGSYDLNKLSDNVIIEQVINPDYGKLVGRISDYKITLAMDLKEKELLTSNIELMEIEINTLQRDLLVAESEFKSISNKLNIAERARDEYQISLKSAVDFQNAGIGEKSVILVSSAESAVPEGQSKVVIILLAVIAGLMLGVFAAFIKNALKTDKKSI